MFGTRPKAVFSLQKYGNHTNNGTEKNSKDTKKSLFVLLMAKNKSEYEGFSLFSLKFSPFSRH